VISNIANTYVLGHSEAEQDRLIRQATLLAPITERVFRDAGIGAGQRVLDVGCGLGDVSMIAARLVGPSGEVVGIERDAAYVARARERVAAVGCRNVGFIQADMNALEIEGPFDGAVGRLVLNHLPDPVAVLRSVSRLVAPGGVVVFQEASWGPTLAVASRVPLWSLLLTTIHDTLLRSGLSAERGLDLHRMFQEAGLGTPNMHLQMSLAGDSSLAELETDMLRTLLPAAERHGVSLVALGDLDTLPNRIHAEAVATNAVFGFLAMASAWSRKAVS
jgi:ubiquinone/menaquinone biosynthesis C-methylase UbiE